MRCLYPNVAGVFLRQPFCCFLTGSDSTIETEDLRVPVIGSRVVPSCVRYCRARSNNLGCHAVEYGQKVLMRDGVARKVVRYPCQVAGVKGAPGIRVAEGSTEHYEQSERAKQMAWRHVELALTGHQPDSVDKRAGTGQLTGSGFYRHHGDPWGDHELHAPAAVGIRVAAGAGHV